MNTKSHKDLALPQLDILRAILDDEKINVRDPKEISCAQAAISLLLTNHGFESICPKTVYAQLQAFTSLSYARSLLQGAPKTYSLHVAAREGNLTEVKKLINLGYSINEADEIFGSTPLHMAAMYGHHEVAAFLIQSGATINATTYVEMGWFGENAYTALDLAIKYEPGTKTLDLLLQRGAKSASDLQTQLLDLFDKILDNSETGNYSQFDLALSKLETIVKNDPHALYILNDSFFDAQEILPIAPILQQFSIKMADQDFYDRVMTTIKLYEAADSDHIAEHYLLAKNLTHAFPSSNTYLFKMGNANGSMIAEGHYSSCTAPLAADLLKKYSSHIQETHDFNGFNAIQKKYHYFMSMDHYDTIKNAIFASITNTYQIGSEALMHCGLHENSKKLFQAYCAGETLVLPSGWDGHAIDIILNKNLNLFMVANAGEQYHSLMPGLNAYNHKYALTADDIYHILMNADKMDLEFKKFYDLGLTVNEKYSFETFPQLYGNCAWYSQQISEKALIFIELTKATGNDKLSLELAEIWFEQLDNFQQTSILKDYLAHPALEVSALGDILFTYHCDLKTVDEKERAKLILDNLTKTTAANLVEFEKYCAAHKSDMTPQLKQFINDYEMNKISDDFNHLQLNETVGDTLKINDVIKLDESSDLLTPLNNHASSHTEATVMAMPTLSEVNTDPILLVPISIIPEHHQVVVLG